MAPWASTASCSPTARAEGARSERAKPRGIVGAAQRKNWLEERPADPAAVLRSDRRRLNRLLSRSRPAHRRQIHCNDTRRCSRSGQPSPPLLTRAGVRSSAVPYRHTSSPPVQAWTEAGKRVRGRVEARHAWRVPLCTAQARTVSMTLRHFVHEAAGCSTGSCWSCSALLIQTCAGRVGAFDAPPGRSVWDAPSTPGPGPPGGPPAA